MKKFYLLIMALVGYATTSIAQDCPTPMPVARNYVNPTNVPPYCKVIYSGGFYPAQLSLKIGGVLIPLWGTGGSTGNAPIYFVDVQADGSATFVYDCYLYGNATHAQIEQVIAGVPVKTCEVGVIQLGALPIKLSAFNGRLNTETEATLAWTSSLEENSFQYEIQRSADGKNFVTVGKIKAAGTSFDAVKYSFNDPLPANGTYWYRLNMIDLDGKTELSKVVYVNSKKGSGIVTKLFPNPFTSEIQLIGATSADLNTQGNIKVFSMSGQLINFRIVGANAIAIDPSAPKGMYFLKFNNGINDQTFKLVKQ